MICGPVAAHSAMHPLTRRRSRATSAAALDAAGYRGRVGIEGNKLPLGLEASIRYDLDYLRPIFPRTLG